MIWIYRLLFPILLILGAPYYLYRMVKRGGYRDMMAGRFGMYREWQKTDGKRRVWIQAVSVGEVLAIGALLEQLQDKEGFELLISTTTSTGFELAKQKYSGKDVRVESFPLDFWAFSARAWERVQPDLAVLMEGELWPEHIYQSHLRKVPLVMINARLSDKSYQRMTKLKALCRALFYDRIDHIAAGSEFDFQRIRSLGVPEDKISVTGNMKFDVVNPEGPSDSSSIEFAQTLKWQHLEYQHAAIIIGASLWPGEESLLINTALNLRKQGLEIRLLLVPRHAERRQEIRSELAAFEGVSWHFRSRPEWCHFSENALLDICVADTTGELKKLLGISSITIIGKSFPPHKQGQTPVEAAALGVPIIYGPGMSNFRAICSQLEENEAAYRIKETSQLEETLAALLRSPDLRRQRIEAGKQVFMNNLGSTDRTMAIIQSFAKQ